MACHVHVHAHACAHAMGRKHMHRAALVLPASICAWSHAMQVRDRCEGYTSAPALFGSNMDALDEVHALGNVEMVPDYSLHGLKGMLALIYETIESALKPSERASLEKNFDHLHKGGATVKSGVHRRLELVSTPQLLGTFELGELREAMDALAQAMVWGIRVTHARWHAQHHFCVLRTAVLMHKFAVLLTRSVPKTKVTKNGEKVRTLYGLFFHQLTTHLVEDLKRVCPMHVMCEWMEMWWGPLRRLTLATSSRHVEHATLNMLRRMCMRERFGKEHGARASYAEPSHSDHGPIGDAYQKNYGECDGERLELDSRFHGTGLESLLRAVPEYLELGEGVWYSVKSRGEEEVIVFHVGVDDPDHALPTRQHFRSQSAHNGRTLEEAAFKRMQADPTSLVKYMKASTASASPTKSAWSEALRHALGAAAVEADTDDEDDEVDEAQQDEAAELAELADAGDDGDVDAELADAGDDGVGVDVDIAPASCAAPLEILEPDTLAGVWSDATTVDGLGEAYLRVDGRTIATFRGTLRRGRPDGHGRIECNGGGWRGEMAVGEVVGKGEAWDEAGNRFTGDTSAPGWLIHAAKVSAACVARGARAARAPFDAAKVEGELWKMKLCELRVALEVAGEDHTRGLKPALVARLLGARRSAHLAAQSGSAGSEDESAVPEGGYAGTIAWACGGEVHGLFEETTFKLLHAEAMTIPVMKSIERAIERAETAASDAAAAVAAVAAAAKAAAAEANAAAAPGAAAVERQALVLLAKEFPADGLADLRDRWKGVSRDGVFKGSVLVLVLALAPDGRLMGFAKGFAMGTAGEAYLDELLVASDARGARLAQHLVVAFIDACAAVHGDTVKRVRLQCKRGVKVMGNREVDLRKDLYAPMAIGTEWVEVTEGAWEGVGPSDTTYVMLHGEGPAVRGAAAALAACKPLAAGVRIVAHHGRRAAADANAAAAAVAAAASAPPPAAVVAAAASAPAAAAPAAARKVHLRIRMCMCMRVRMRVRMP